MEWNRPVRKWDWEGGEKLQLPLFPELHCLLFMVLWNTSRTCQWSPFSAKRSSDEFYSHNQMILHCSAFQTSLLYGIILLKHMAHARLSLVPPYLGSFTLRQTSTRKISGACKLWENWKSGEWRGPVSSGWGGISVEIPSQWQAVLRPLLLHGPSHWGQSFESRGRIRCIAVSDVSAGDAERQGNRHGASSLQPGTECSKKAAALG